MADCLFDKHVKTRKPHYCYGCGRLFPAGTTLRLYEGVDAGEFYRSYWCKACDEVWANDDYYAYEGGVGFGEMKYDPAWEETRAKLEGR